jgi:hypothetical protein
MAEFGPSSVQPTPTLLTKGTISERPIGNRCMELLFYFNRLKLKMTMKTKKTPAAGGDSPMKSMLAPVNTGPMATLETGFGDSS